MDNTKYLNGVDVVPTQTPDRVLEQMELRAQRAVASVENRAKRAIREILEREEEYKESVDERIEQMKDLHRADSGVPGRMSSAQRSAEVVKKEISAVSAKARNEIAERVKRFRDGIAVVRIEVDSQILTPEAAYAFIDKVREHALMEQERIDEDFTDTDTAMRRRSERPERPEHRRQI